jgi:hypothetical protein
MSSTLQPPAVLAREVAETLRAECNGHGKFLKKAFVSPDGTRAVFFGSSEGLEGYRAAADLVVDVSFKLGVWVDPIYNSLDEPAPDDWLQAF